MDLLGWAQRQASLPVRHRMRRFLGASARRASGTELCLRVPPFLVREIDPRDEMLVA